MSPKTLKRAISRRETNNSFDSSKLMSSPHLASAGTRSTQLVLLSITMNNINLERFHLIPAVE